MPCSDLFIDPVIPLHLYVANDVVSSLEGIHTNRAGLPFSVRPNPFSASTTFTYTLTEPSQVLLRVFDGFGQLVDEPVKGFQSQGEHKIEWKTENLPAGVYYCRLQAGDRMMSNKIIKIK